MQVLRTACRPTGRLKNGADRSPQNLCISVAERPVSMERAVPRGVREGKGRFNVTVLQSTIPRFSQNDIVDNMVDSSHHRGVEH